MFNILLSLLKLDALCCQKFAGDNTKQLNSGNMAAFFGRLTFSTCKQMFASVVLL